MQLGKISQQTCWFLHEAAEAAHEGINLLTALAGCKAVPNTQVGTCKTSLAVPPPSRTVSHAAKLGYMSPGGFHEKEMVFYILQCLFFDVL